MLRKHIKILSILWIVFFIQSCSDLKNPVIYTKAEMIPEDIAIKYLNSKKENLGKCTYSISSMSYKTFTRTKYISYNELYFNVYKYAGSFVIDVTKSGQDYICYYDFANNETKMRKFADALTSLGVTFKSGYF